MIVSPLAMIIFTSNVYKNIFRCPETFIARSGWFQNWRCNEIASYAQKKKLNNLTAYNVFDIFFHNTWAHPYPISNYFVLSFALNLIKVLLESVWVVLKVFLFDSFDNCVAWIDITIKRNGFYSLFSKLFRRTFKNLSKNQPDNFVIFELIQLL